LTLGLSALAAAHRRRRGTSSGSWKSLKCASAGIRRNQGRIAWHRASQCVGTIIFTVQDVLPCFIAVLSYLPAIEVPSRQCRNGVNGWQRHQATNGPLRTASTRLNWAPSRCGPVASVCDSSHRSSSVRVARHCSWTSFSCDGSPPNLSCTLRAPSSCLQAPKRKQIRFCASHSEKTTHCAYERCSFAHIS